MLHWKVSRLGRCSICGAHAAVTCDNLTVLDGKCTTCARRAFVALRWWPHCSWLSNEAGECPAVAWLNEKRQRIVAERVAIFHPRT